MKQNQGNILPAMMIIVGISLVIVMLVIAILIGTVNGLIHTIKTDMYFINKSAVLSVNKTRANIDDFSYHTKEYEKFFRTMLQKNYHLNDALENREGLIQKVLIEEYQIYPPNKKDAFTQKRTEGRVIHTVVMVKVKPIILAKYLEKVFTFQVHEDVYLEMPKH